MQQSFTDPSLCRKGAVSFELSDVRCHLTVSAYVLSGIGILRYIFLSGEFIQTNP